MHICVPSVCLVPVEVRRGYWIPPGTGLMDGWEPFEYWELNPGPLREQGVLLTPEAFRPSPLGIHLKRNQAGSELTMKPKKILNSWLSCLYLPSTRPACQFQLLSCLFEEVPLLLSQIWPASFDWLLSHVSTLLLDSLPHWNSFVVSISSLGSPARERPSHTILPLFLRTHACLMTFRLRTSDSQNFTPENSLKARFKVHFSPRRQLRFLSRQYPGVLPTQTNLARGF